MVFILHSSNTVYYVYWLWDDPVTDTGLLVFLFVRVCRLCLSKNWSISCRVSDLWAQCCSQPSFVLLLTSVGSAVMSPLSLRISVSSLFPQFAWLEASWIDAHFKEPALGFIDVSLLIS